MKVKNIDENLFEVRKKNIWQKYNSLKSTASVIVYYFDYFSDTIEKTAALINWKDQTASKMLLIYLMISFIVVTFLPMRLFAVIISKNIFDLTNVYSCKKVFKGKR